MLSNYHRPFPSPSNNNTIYHVSQHITNTTYVNSSSFAHVGSQYDFNMSPSRPSPSNTPSNIKLKRNYSSPHPSCTSKMHSPSHNQNYNSHFHQSEMYTPPINPTNRNLGLPDYKRSYSDYQYGSAGADQNGHHHHLYATPRPYDYTNGRTTTMTTRAPPPGNYYDNYHHHQEYCNTCDMSSLTNGSSHSKTSSVDRELEWINNNIYCDPTKELDRGYTRPRNPMATVFAYLEQYEESRNQSDTESREMYINLKVRDRPQSPMSEVTLSPVVSDDLQLEESRDDNCCGSQEAIDKNKTIMPHPAENSKFTRMKGMNTKRIHRVDLKHGKEAQIIALPYYEKEEGPTELSNFPLP